METPLTEEDQIKGQQEINAWVDNIPNETAKLLKQLEEKIGQMETFDLLSNISLYNHVHDAQQYSDYREDRMFVISELIALIALKRNYVQESLVDANSSQLLLKDIQELGNKYFALMTFLQLKDSRPEDDHSIEGIAFKTMRDETIIRNPALPEHHLLFAEELYAPLEPEIKKKFGFTIKESIALRQHIVEQINERFFNAKDAAEQKALQLAMQVFKCRATKTVPEDSVLSKENLDELNSLSRKRIREACFHHCMGELFFRISEVYCFTAAQLSEASGLNLTFVDSFLKQFCCTFPSLTDTDALVGPSSILKTKPLIEHQGKFLVPSMPLLTWCVEPVIEDYIKSVQKLQDKFKGIKHDFLLRKGVEFLSQIFGEAVHIHTNLYYHDDNDAQKRCETDAIFRYERTLFTIEAKAHRISQQAKEGKVLRTEKHMEQIVRDSYEQGVRTLNFVRSRTAAEFLTERNKKIVFSKNDFDEVILISLVLEPIGNVTPLIRATNDLGYFKHSVFPWIISVYDLIVIADHLELPVLLPHYIKRRKEFLERKVMHVFEEIDLMSYYLFNRLYIEGMFRDAESNDVSMVYLDNETDAVNNYYMHKYRRKNPNPPKLTLKISDVFLKILRSLEASDFSHRQELMQYILDLPPAAVEKFKGYIQKVKNLFAKDGLKHDCSILTHIWGKKVGFTYITEENKIRMDRHLYFFCRYKMDSLEADVWIGIGDTDRGKTEFSIQSAFVARTQQ